MNIQPTPFDTVRGDATGLVIPAHIEALRTAGAEFLTEAFRIYGSLTRDNRVVRITRFERCFEGSTGQKLFLSVEYERPDPGLHTDLFVKFSRDFSDPIRDNKGKSEMESEIRFADITRLPGFPVNVPIAYFADYHHESHTGLLITQQVAFGRDGVEPHREKCRDHELADPIAYYRVLIKTMARIAAAHKAGRLSSDVDARFPYDPVVAAARYAIPFDADKIHNLIAKYADFAAKSPQLLPANIRSPEFIAQLDRDAVRILEHEKTIKTFLQSNRDLIALCHWNANIDNAWFWRDAEDRLQCGLMDWGNVNQMNIAFPLWGCLCAANYTTWDEHFEDLIKLYADEFHTHGGPHIDVSELKLNLHLHMALRAVGYVINCPSSILLRLPEAATASGALDPVFEKSEPARNQLSMMTACLNFWQTQDFGASLDRMLARVGKSA